METMEERLLKQYFGADAVAMENARMRLSQNEPLAYILGETVFFDEYYYVTPATLIPRPDTERVVEWVIKKLPEQGRLLDLCCGSGCIGISSIRHSVGTEGVSLDISADALEVAKRNAKRNDVADRICFLQADLTKDMPQGTGMFDVIVSNPPYIATDVIETLMPEVKEHEPRLALDGTEDGLFFYRKIVDESRSYLKNGGMLYFEIGHDQGAEVKALMEQAGFIEVVVVKDYAGLDRVVYGTKKEVDHV